ncbi:response regulator [Oribacterium sp. WCC10]|uniref:response regulator n=1 Tax=Oribacterium sp. WCC10 TaxID=1855343 RepID=UPI0015872A48|nr:response regulator [Oribacterium sp. WCC10]
MDADKWWVMYQKTFVVHSLAEVKNVVEDPDLRGFFTNTKDAYVQIYTAKIHEDDLKEMLVILHTSFPGIKTAGMSLFGTPDINNDYAAIMSFMFFHSSHAETFIYDFTTISEEDGTRELNTLFRSSSDLKAVALYPVGHSIGISRIIDDISAGLDDIPFFGSLASAHLDDFSKTILPYSFTDETVKYGMAVVAFYGEELNILIDACLGWKPLGRTFTAHINKDIQLRVGDTCLEKLDDTPVVELYKYYLDADVDTYNLSNITEFPILLARNGIPMVRIPFMAGDNGEFYYYGDINEGERVQIGYGNPREILREAEKLSLRMQDFVPEALTSFICVSRYMLLGKRFTIETDDFKRILPQATFAHGAGEIYKYRGFGGMLSGSIVSIGMREGPITESMTRTSYRLGQELRPNGIVPLSERLVSYLEKTSFDLNEMAIKADQANKAKSEFLSRMSHEIRTPINAIMGMNEMILRESTDPHILGYAGSIATSGELLLGIINDILDFSKIEAGKMPLIPTAFDLLKLIVDLVQITRQNCEKKNLKFELILNEDMPYMLHFDEKVLKQIISNILSNAGKYTDEGKVTFSLDFEKIDDNYENLTVHVIDTGIGVKPEDQKRLFVDFERFDEQNHRTTQGSGLGLSIVQRLLEMADSKLEFTSEYGKGSDFYFTVKIEVLQWDTIRSHKDDFDLNISTVKHYHESFRAPDVRVLVVDDVEVNRFVFRSLLKKTELNITEASGGQEAIDLCTKNKYDLIFMDHLMPDVDGIKAFHSIRKLDADWTHDVPVIALTANAINGARNMYLEEGFIDYLPKPISPTHLEAKLIQYLPKDKVQIVEDEDTGNSDPPGFSVMGGSRAIDEAAGMVQASGVDIISGLNYCGDIVTYQKALVSFVESIPNHLATLKHCKDTQDINGFILVSHSVKSTAKAVGATQLGRLAEILEKAAKAHDFETIIEHAPIFAMNLSAIQEKLNPVVAQYKQYMAVGSQNPLIKHSSDSENNNQNTTSKDSNKSSKGESKDMMQDPMERIGEIHKLNGEETVQAVKVLKQKADEFDFDSCEKLVDFLAAQSISKEIKSTLMEVKAALEDIDWDKVQSLLSDL